MNKVEFGPIVTASERMKSLLTMAQNVASSKATILLTGESGTGKEIVAKYIHEKSPRAGRRLIAINCAAVPEGLLESELFGYERGAFTGANQAKMGKIEQASYSTLLLDEISEMPLLLQAKLLRVLQEEEVDRLGGVKPVKVNLRIIATSNKDLRSLVNEGKFREDLFYRLNVIPLHIPPLRQRPEDVGILSEHFCRVAGIINNRQVKLSDEALAKLSRWNWPGNVRELENVIERAVLIAKGNVISQADVILESQDQSGRPNAEHLIFEVGTTIEDMEKKLIFRTLERTNQNRTRAATILGISIRTLRNKLKTYRMEVPSESDV